MLQGNCYRIAQVLSTNYWVYSCGGKTSGIDFETSATVCMHCSFDSDKRLKLYYGLVNRRNDCISLDSSATS